MPSFNHQRFFADFAARTGLQLTEPRKQGLEFLLNAFAADAEFTMLRECAYVLATIQWETAQTFQPIPERRFSKERNPRAWANQTRYWRTGFYGRGYVQLTWGENYRNTSTKLSGLQTSVNGNPVSITATTFTEHPDYVLEPSIAYVIAARGMREGWFTGKKLSAFIREDEAPDYVNARRIINGTDKAEEIALLAVQCELLLRAAAV